METLLNIKTMHASDQICLIMLRIYDRVLTTTSGGNISIIDEEENIWITPAGIDKGLLKPSDIVCMRKDGTVVGDHKPSSEYPFHLAIYKKRPDIKAIVHAHPPGMVAFSIVRKTPDTRVLPQTHQLCGDIGYAAYALPGTEALGKSIANEFEKGFSVVIMENHGTVIGGTDISNAYQKFESIEVSARSILSGSSIGTPIAVSDAGLAAHKAQQLVVLPEQEEQPFYPAKDREKRAQILKIVKRACKQGLMLGAYGSVSARSENDDFVITPNAVSKWDLALDDLVQVKDGKREKNKMPDSAALLHQAIYAKHKHVNAIIITQPIYLTSFAITGADFNVRTIPETWIYLQDVKMTELEHKLSGTEKIAESISEQSPVLIVKNECVIVTGNKLLQAFDYLEVAEFSAKSVILSASLGKMIPISDGEIDELGKVMGRWKNYEWKM
ncbi:class II aldolase/adducin family protein [Chitinophaga sp. MM2321]|uniref:class II aldolase/adducin family protein n=1 Tax=Chitinophaga sp. MM2321 TaxID=3137178 RepID=UPI0032D58F7F